MSARSLVFLFAIPALYGASSLDWVDGLGGRIDRDALGDVIGVHLRGSWVSDTELLDLAQLPKLEFVDLSHTRITDDGLLHLKSLRQIRDLNLYYAEQVTDQGMTAIRDWKNLKRLNVRGTRISDGTLAIVSGLAQIESLDIAYAPFTDNGLDALVTLTQLKELSIGRSRLNKNALEVLRLLPTLEYLDLGGPHPGAGGLRDTTGTPMGEDVPRAVSSLPALRVLKLGYSQIGAEGLEILGSLERVEKLALEGCSRVDDAAIAQLAKWKSLKYLDVQETKVTSQGVAALQKAKPGIVVLLAGRFRRQMVVPDLGFPEKRLRTTPWGHGFHEPCQHLSFSTLSKMIVGRERPMARVCMCSGLAEPLGHPLDRWSCDRQRIPDLTETKEIVGAPVATAALSRSLGQMNQCAAVRRV